MNLQVLSEIALLRKPFPAIMTHVGLDPTVHPHMVEEVTSAQELLVSAVMLANVNCLVSAAFRLPFSGGILKVFQKF